MFMARKHHHHKHHHRRNPLGIGRDEIATVGWGVAGAVGVSLINSKFLPNQSTGPIGYAVKAGLAIGGGYLGRTISKNAGQGILLGGLIAVGIQMVKDYLGASLGMGAYWNSPFALPTMSNAQGVVATNPYATLMPPAPAPVTRMSGTRIVGRTGR
jgi:hypothetical protein